jgi:hypothetical protein
MLERIGDLASPQISKLGNFRKKAMALQLPIPKELGAEFVLFERHIFFLSWEASNRLKLSLSSYCASPLDRIPVALPRCALPPPSSPLHWP